MTTKVAIHMAKGNETKETIAAIVTQKQSEMRLGELSLILSNLGFHVIVTNGSLTGARRWAQGDERAPLGIVYLWID